MIPEEIKKKIEDTAKYCYNELVTTSDNGQKKQRQYQSRFIEGAEYGYQLAQEEITTLKRQLSAYKTYKEASEKIQSHQSKLLDEEKTVESEREANSILTNELEAAQERIKELEEGLLKLYKDSMASDFNEHWDSYLNAGKLLNK